MTAYIVGYTETYGIYQDISTSGKRFLIKNPIPVKEDEEDETSLPIWNEEREVSTNYDTISPLKTPDSSTTPTFGTPEGQVLVEYSQTEISEPPRKPRRSVRIRDQGTITPWNERLKQGVAGASRIQRVGHNEEYPTDEQTKTSPKAHQ